MADSSSALPALRAAPPLARTRGPAAFLLPLAREDAAPPLTAMPSSSSTMLPDSDALAPPRTKGPALLPVPVPHGPDHLQLRQSHPGRSRSRVASYTPMPSEGAVRSLTVYAIGPSTSSGAALSELSSRSVTSCAVGSARGP